MNQELIEFLRGELAEGEARELRARLADDADLARELSELQALFGFMRRGEEIVPSRELRAAVADAAERATAPSLIQQLAALPGLVRHRFRQSLAFRIAAVSLAVHLVAMGILFQVSVTRSQPRNPIEIGVRVAPEDLPLYRPDATFTLRLSQRRLPHAARLRKVGVQGQERAIRRGLDELVGQQRDDGSFGTVADTGYAALALLAEGECSAYGTARGRAVQRAVRHLIAATRRGEVHGATLAALVEDWTLSFDRLSDDERVVYIDMILRLIRRVGDDPSDHEGLALARMAGFPMRESREFGEAAWLFTGRREKLLEEAATRIGATAVLGRGQGSLDAERARLWARPLFEQAMRALEARKGDPVAVLTLQAPYRL